MVKSMSRCLVVPKLRLTFLVLILLFLIITLQPFLAFWMDIVIDVGTDNLCSECSYSPGDEQSEIPLNIHQIFFTIKNSQIPLQWRHATESWTRLNPDFKYILWNSSTVESLIVSKYPQLWDTYREYGHWVQRIDMAKYIILHQYGGIYVDTDIECLESMKNVFKKFPENTKVVVYEAYPWGKASEFIICSRKHPFMASVVQGLYRAHRWYIAPYARPMFTTGPMYFGGRYAAFTNKENILVLNNYTFLNNLHGGTWHSSDGRIIYFFYGYLKNILSFKRIIVLMCLVAILRFLAKMKHLSPVKSIFSETFKGHNY